MSEFAIRVSGLSKMFKIYPRPSDMFWEVVTGKPRHREFWALRDVSFEVSRGQVVGIIGRNGAGKSTLLKIVTGTLDTTAGSVEVEGRVSSILELGTGFHGEYTGRENIRLGGLMVGMSRQEIADKEDWVIDFSELRDFIDQPFRTYSSGMQARLTFSTAVCVDPDILIVDEALSVGDAKFQRKSYAKFEEFRSSGRTILLVSHDVNTINQICDRAILLGEGRIIEQGEPKEVTRTYERLLFGVKARTPETESAGDLPAGRSQEAEKEARMESDRRSLVERVLKEKTEPDGPEPSARYGNRRAEIVDCGIVDARGERLTVLESGREYTLFSRVWFHDDIEDVNLGYGVRTVKGAEVFAVNSFVQRVSMPAQSAGNLLEGQVDLTMWLAPGDYFLTVGAWGLRESTHYDRLVDAVHFQVTGDCRLLSQSLVNLEARVSVRQLPSVPVE